MLLALAIHFLSVFIYSKPFYSQKTKADFYAQAYIYPYFQQSWNLFAPIPTANYKLFYEYENKGSQKTDLFSEIKIQHQSNRLKGYEPFVIAFSNSFFYFEKNTSLLAALNGPVTNDLNFTIIEHVAKNYLEHSKKIEIKKLKLVLVVEPTDGSKQRIYYN